MYIQQAEAKNATLLKLPQQFPHLKEAAQWVLFSCHTARASVGAVDWSVSRQYVNYVPLSRTARRRRC